VETRGGELASVLWGKEETNACPGERAGDNSHQEEWIPYPSYCKFTILGRGIPDDGASLVRASEEQAKFIFAVNSGWGVST
jgi:hypothetical protein